VNRHTLRVLEFEKIRTRVRDRCLTAEAARAIGRDRLETDPGKVRSLLDSVELLTRLLATPTEFPTVAFPPVERTLARAEKEGVVLEPLELAEIAVFMRSSLDFDAYLRAGAASAGLGESVDRLIGAHPKVEPVVARLLRYLEPNGTIREREIPELRAIRNDILRSQQELQ
jgi:dsDNA-specific endonuclease/ATPase MutS2